MKKLLIIVLLCVFGITNAQNYLHVNIMEIEDWHTYEYCASQYDGVVIEKESGCDSWTWHVSIGGQTYLHAINEFDEITLEVPTNLNQFYAVTYHGCNIIEREFNVGFAEFTAPEPWAQDYQWKRTGESIQLNAYGGYNYQWSTGSTNPSITVTNPGTYWVRIYNDCGELYDTIQVRNNVEIELATCDLETNLNMVTWPTTTAQAEYVDHVIIKRDGVQVGTVNYTDGYFLDNIGSDAASRTYTITAVAPDGAQCPIVSCPKETIHMSYTLGMGNTIEMGWNAPTGYDLMGFNICEWHPDGELTVVDYVGSSVTSYTCNESMFNLGNIVVQGVENGKNENRLLSNRSWETVGIAENVLENGFKVYPNPANSVLFVETRRATSLPVETEYRIINPMGQTVVQGAITSSEKQQINVRDLPNGVYFITVDGVTQKFVVE